MALARLFLDARERLVLVGRAQIKVGRAVGRPDDGLFLMYCLHLWRLNKWFLDPWNDLGIAPTRDLARGLRPSVGGAGGPPTFLSGLSQVTSPYVV
jgi:hypothetical protein